MNCELSVYFLMFCIETMLAYIRDHLCSLHSDNPDWIDFINFSCLQISKGKSLEWMTLVIPDLYVYLLHHYNEAIASIVNVSNIIDTTPMVSELRLLTPEDHSFREELSIFETDT